MNSRLGNESFRGGLESTIESNGSVIRRKRHSVVAYVSTSHYSYMSLHTHRPEANEQ